MRRSVDAMGAGLVTPRLHELTATAHLRRDLRRLRWLFAAMSLLGAGVCPTDTLATTGALTARLVDLRNDKGKVGCALYASEKGFPKDNAAAAQTRWCAIAKGESTCSFAPIPAGTYAVACFHDENDNGKMDTNFLGIPTEGVAVSNDAKGVMGPPSFKDAKFSFAGTATELRLKMKYL